MYDQIDFRFRYQAGMKSIHAVLLRYLESKQTEFPKEQMILWSLSAFWHPLACMWLGKYNEAQLRQKALNAIYQLQQQINYLSQTFGIELQELALTQIGSELPHQTQSKKKEDLQPAAMPNREGVPSSAIAVAMPSPLVENAEAELTSATTKDLMRSEDDIALDEAFDN